MNLTTIRRKRHSQVGFWDSRHMLQIIFYDLTNFFKQRNSGERGISFHIPSIVITLNKNIEECIIAKSFGCSVEIQVSPQASIF
jgi:hypothetical protein